MTVLMHYAAEPLHFDRARTYEQHEPRTFGKPNGFWVSVQGADDWHSWVTDNMDTQRLTHASRVTLTGDANILYLPDVVAMQGFHDNWTVETEFERKYRPARDHWPINWRAIADRYAGIIIAPYHWPCRYPMDWYYGWDCASGCIWDLSAIASVEHVDAEAVAP